MDLCMVFKIVYGLVDLDFDQFFQYRLSGHNTRGHSKRLFVRGNSRLNSTKNFFSVRVIQVWNCLPQNVVDSTSLSIFKNHISSITFDEFSTVV